MATGFYRNQKASRQHAVMDLPRSISDAAGAVVKTTFEHYTRVLLEWARNITEEVEGRSVVRQQWWDANSSGYTADGLTDMFALDTQLTGGWFYGIHVLAPVSYTGVAGDRCLAHVIAGNKLVGRVADLTFGVQNHINGWVFFRCPRTALYNVGLTLDFVVGAGPIVLAADADVHREVNIVGFGLAPTSFDPT